MSMPAAPLGDSDRVLIVGAGIVGLGIGWQLARQGIQVCVVDAHEAGHGASSAAAGMLAATAEVNFEEDALLELNHLSASMYPAFVELLEQESGEHVDFRTFGSLVIGLDRDDTEALQRLLHYQHSKHLPAELLSGEQARELEPALAPGVHSAVWCAHDHQVDPVRLIVALCAALRAAGGTLREHAPVERLWVEQGRCVGVQLEGGERLEAERVVVAAGAWTRGIGGVERRQLPRIRPVRGQMLALDMEDAPLCTRVIRAPDAYMVPRSNGELIIGATMEERGFDGRQTAGGLFELLRGAWETMPGIYDLPWLRSWTGFRPMSLRNEPVLGVSPHIRDLWFATGHGRNGVLLAPVTAVHMTTSLIKGALHESLQRFEIK